MNYVVCDKCNVVCNKYSVVYRYEINNKVYVNLEYICRCKNIINKHMLAKEYYRELMNYEKL